MICLCKNCIAAIRSRGEKVMVGEWTLKGAKMIKIDGKKYKPDTWYTMENGKIVKWEDEE